MPQRPCLDCGRLTPQSRCLACQRARARRRETTRPSPTTRGYGSAWRRLRARIVARDGHACRQCGTAGTHGNPLTVHHVLAKALGGIDDEANLITLCKRCHGRVGPQG